MMWTLFVALPGIIFWGLGIPLFGMFLLFLDRKNLHKLEIKQKYGFLFNGYQKNYYYWEGVIIFRKIALIFISVFLDSFGLMS